MSLQYESSLIVVFSIIPFSLPIRKCSKQMPPPLASPSISNQTPRSQPALRRSSVLMAQQDDGWPLGLRLLNARVGLLENRDFSGSISFNTLPTGSPISFTDSSDLDSQSSGSFLHAKSISGGSLISGSDIVELSRRSSRVGSTETSLGGYRKNDFKSKPWLFSLCCKLSTDAVSVTRTHSLAHFLEAERRRTAGNCRRNQLRAMMQGRPRPNNLLAS
ncbi:uncharacterized protein LOC111781890 isoform X1 [Cucurbita pepo subsp. pepo]|uniref:uncharacterized protein LOC111781890 isoform X1 n=1 Tax=Cucurbita pepo subsp. pepo TaxID=3664 RepID=UPI000C9DA743|nr:uncharacterized protein LOC111781890 isoform X1 [Cucurbita pepo subsp. pepo]